VLAAVAIETAVCGSDLDIVPMNRQTICRGTIAECMAEGGGGAEDDEIRMDSEVNRRILATTRYISYGALQAGIVPCPRRGASYYNCRPGAPANPYTRSCSAITQCR
ncbi:rapid alkalinization factor 2, partial [Genlisea aurea]